MRTQQALQLTGTLGGAVDDIDRALAAGNVDLQIDFSKVEHVTVEGLEWLEELLLRSQSLQSQVSFISVPPVIYKVFKVAHIQSLLKACGSMPVSGPAC